MSVSLQCLLQIANILIIAAGSQKKQFTLDEVRMMIDGMNNGLRYNRQGQVSTVTEEVVFTIVELQHLMTELQTQGGFSYFLIYLNILCPAYNCFLKYSLVSACAIYLADCMFCFIILSITKRT